MKLLGKIHKRISQKSRKPVSCLETIKNPVLEAQQIYVSKFKKKTKPYKKLFSWVNQKAKEDVPRKGWHSRNGELAQMERKRKPIYMAG